MFDQKLRILAAALLLAVSVQAGGAGLGTHMEVAEHTPPLIDDALYAEPLGLLLAYPDDFATGSVFPDWGYLFDDTAEAAEATHWPPFYESAVAFVHRRYGDLATGGPRGEHVARLLVFIFGIASHGAMDEAWHFGDTAFLNVAIAIDQPPGDAHAAVELLTDIFVQVEQRRGPDRHHWYVPIADLTALYHALGYPEVTAERMLEGVALQFLGAYLEDVGAWAVYRPAGELLPWTRANYFDYFDGGIIDGAGHGARAIEGLWDIWEDLSTTPSDGRGMPYLGPREARDDDQSLPRYAGVAFRSLAARLWEEGALSFEIRRLEFGAVEFAGPRMLDPGAVLEGLGEVVPSR